MKAIDALFVNADFNSVSINLESSNISYNQVKLLILEFYFITMYHVNYEVMKN